MIQVCLRLTTASWVFTEDLAEVRLFMKNTAPNTAIAIGSTHIRPAFCRNTPPTGLAWNRLMTPSVIRIGVSSCTLETPMLPPAALRPSADPFIRSGKKKEMLVMLEAKLPPPRPAGEASSSISPNRGAGGVEEKADAHGRSNTDG